MNVRTLGHPAIVVLPVPFVEGCRDKRKVWLVAPQNSKMRVIEGGKTRSRQLLCAGCERMPEALRICVNVASWNCPNSRVSRDDKQ